MGGQAQETEELHGKHLLWEHLMSPTTSFSRFAVKEDIQIESGTATHQIGGQRLTYFFFLERGWGDLAGSKKRSFQGHFDTEGHFRLHGGFEVETKSAYHDPSHAGVTTHRKSLNKEREEAITKIELFRELALEKQSELRATFNGMAKELVAENSTYDILSRENRTLKAWSVKDKLYLEEFRGDKVWLSHYEHDESYEDALRSIQERVTDY